ncbi:hypothetical protein AX15_007343 [Amanita polypyramis BW_CC]|nr:hypothetical protein AX15_007343 [Amanita polypyramis BW_CC]
MTTPTDDIKTAQGTLDALGNGILIKRPSSTYSPTRDDQSPTVVILFGWMGAKLSHLLKYSQGYDQLYPTATQVLIRCEAITFWKPEWMNRASLRPAVEALEALGCITPLHPQAAASGVTNNSTTTKHRILVHTFSNGGCVQFTTLSKQLYQHYSTNASASALILDSCPGTGSLSVTIRAFHSTVPFAPLRIMLTLYLYVFYSYIGIRSRLTEIPTFWETLRTQLNQSHILPWMQESSPRLYIYSNKDDMISWQDVESHAKDAEKWCKDVRKEKFEDSMHVAHMRQDPERYWKAVQDVWNAACKVRA